MATQAPVSFALLSSVCGDVSPMNPKWVSKLLSNMLWGITHPGLSWNQTTQMPEVLATNALQLGLSAGIALD